MEFRKLAAILAADVVGYSRLAYEDEERTLARLRSVWRDVLDPAIAIHNGRLVKRAGDGVLVEFRSVVDAVRCAIEFQGEVAERNTGLPSERRLDFRIGVHLGDVVQEADGDLMGAGVNVAARLESIAETGTICLSEDAYRQVKAQLNVKARDLGLKTLKNIPDPIKVYSIGPEGFVAPRVQDSGRESPNPPALSLAVLPFANLSPENTQDHFIDGLADGLTTDLAAHVPNLFVTGLRSAYAYKGTQIEPKQIGRDLGVRFVLLGNVQQSSKLVRVNARLMNTETGMQVWAERFDGEPGDLLQLQDQITARIANSLGLALLVDNARALELRAGNPNATELSMKGWAAFFLGDRTLENFRVAEPCYREALAIDPNHPDSLIGLGAVIAGRLFNFGVYDLSPGQLRKEIVEADALLDRGLAAKPNSAAAHAAKGILLACQQRWREALPFISAAHSLDPSSALFALNLGNSLSSLGRVLEALPYFREAIRRSPRDPSMGLLQLSLGRAHLLLGQWEEAMEACLNARAKVPSMFLVHVTLAAALAKMGQIEAARSSVADAIQTEPKLSLSWLKSHTYSTDSAYVRLAEQTLYDGLRLAGLRETVDRQHPSDRSPDVRQSTKQT